AHCSSWGDFKKKEQDFLNAERTRLLYVAATRAQSALIVTVMPKYSNRNPWEPFSQYLKIAPEIQVPEKIREVSSASNLCRKSTENVSDSEALSDIERIGKNLEELRRPCYEVVRASKAISVPDREGRSGIESRGAIPVFPDMIEAINGNVNVAQWGTAIHALIEIAMKNPLAIDSSVCGILEENDLPLDSKDEALRIVRKVMDSEIFKRAKNSTKILVETLIWAPLRDDGATLMRGVIDLAFKEPSGWVIVDYKTDAVGGEAASRKAEKYSEQLNLYACTFEKATGEKVSEKLVYFVNSNVAVPV
ncbi:MAG: PD-(D/E)XK nuclease family protein, partial [Actinomycetota bacterium]|nr:PD-(D/E)XK nuclease family protein [Actinomycetota bacterium]